jgi:hypothetical protein
MERMPRPRPINQRALRIIILLAGRISVDLETRPADAVRSYWQ